VSLLVVVPMSFGKDPNGEDPYSRLLLEHPTPKLSSNTWKTIRSHQKNFSEELEGKLRINVQNGVIESVTISRSTGSKAADAELVKWIEKKWRFRPETTKEINVPVILIAPRTSATGAPIIATPLILRKRELAQLKTIRARRMIIRLEIDHGTITKINVSESTGDPKLDAAAIRWVEEHWIFAKDQSGLFRLPVALIDN
jgi:hypothetical protein